MLKVELVTPARRLFGIDADSVTFNAVAGEMTVLPGHIATMTSMLPGILTVQKGSDVQRFAVGGGSAQVDRDRVIVLAESAEAASEIDIERARRARDGAEKAMRDQNAYEEHFAETQAAMARASVRLTLGGGK